MNTLLWIIQCLLALVFTLVGLMMLTTPKERIIQRAMGGTRRTGYDQANRHPGAAWRHRAHCADGHWELPWLTPLAAVGLALTMVGALVTHLRHHEYPNLLLPFILLLLALFVAYGRFVLVPA